MEQNRPSGCPVNHGAASLPGTGATDYERYLRVDELLQLQKNPEEMAHPDEMLFTAVHQSFEIWCKEVLFELQRIREYLDKDDWPTAVRLLRRIRIIIAANKAALAVFDTMAPPDFHEVRRQLGQGSGAESPGFRTILAKGPKIWGNVEDLLARNGAPLDRIYFESGYRSDLFVLLEALTDFDQELHSWRQVHLQVVKRIIGFNVKSLKGQSIKILQEDIHTMLFPELWTLRDRLTNYEGTSPE